MSKTISGLPLAETLTGDELVPVVQDGNTVQATVDQVVALVGNTANWGDIHGTLSNQTDLQTALDAKVPYTGATGNVNLGEYGLTSGYFQADLTPSGASAVGRMVWNPDFRTTDLGLGGGNVVLHIGQKQVILVVNKTGATLTGSDYQVVKISGAQGQRPKVALAQANNDANSADTIGIVNETITNNQEGFVCTTGTITNINTTGSMQGETWADGDVLYLSGTTAGRLTNIKPQAPIHTVIVGFVIYAHNNQGKIYVKVDNGYELNELHNVRINGVTDGQVLAYDSTLSVWENINQSAITSGNSDRVDGYHVQVDGTGTDPNTIYFKTTGGVDPSQAIWGDITGSIVDQTDLYNALVTGSYATGNWNINASSVDGYSVQVDGTGTDPNTIYFKTTGGTISVDWDNVLNTPTTVAGYGITDVFTETESDARFLGISATAVNSDKVDGYHVQVDGTGTDPNTIYFKTTGGSISVDWDDVSNTPTTVSGYGITDAVTTSGNQTVGGTKTFSSTITGSITGNAGTVTNGVYTSGNQTIGGTKTFSSTISGSIDGNSNTVDGYHVQVDGTGTDPNTIYFKTTGGGIGVDWDDISNTPTTLAGYGISDAYTIDEVDDLVVALNNELNGKVGLTGDQTIGGTKTFSSTITGSITGNAGTVTDGVYLSGTQTITGNKTFTGSVTMGQSGGGEGGEIFWLDPVQGTVVTDVPASGAFRVFQASGTAKGAYIDLANCAGGVGSLLLHSTNYNSYAPTLTGTGASGTWGISVTGNAGTVTNGVYTTGNQTIGGVKTLSSNPIFSESGFQYFYHASDHIAYYKKTGAYNWYWRRNDTGLAGGANDTTLMDLNDSGHLTVYGDIRAPVFYDYNNTAYYLNPADTGTSMVVAGNVGIGTSSPAQKLTVEGNIAVNAGFLIPYNGVTPTGYIGYGTSLGTANDISIRSDTGNILFGFSGSEKMRLNTSGNLGIGTTSPAQKLHVNGNARVSNGTGFTTANSLVRQIESVAGAENQFTIGSVGFLTGAFSDAGQISFSTAQGAGLVERMRIDSSGKVLVGAGATASLGKLVVSEASSGTAVIALESQGSWNSQISTTSAGNMIFSNGTTERLRIDASGNVIASTSMYAPIFYDSNNSAFYVNPNGTSNINDLVVNGFIQGRSCADTNVNTANDTGSISIRGSSTTVASMSFHRTGTYAMNMGLGTDNVFRIGGWSASNNCLQMDGSGNLTMLNNVTAYSDARLKTDVVKIENALDKVQQLNGYTYTRTDTGSKQTGVIAQEVMKVLPEVVMGSEDTHYSVAYGNMVGLLIEAIKEQQSQINELKLTIEQLKGN